MSPTSALPALLMLATRYEYHLRPDLCHWLGLMPCFHDNPVSGEPRTAASRDAKSCCDVLGPENDNCEVEILL